MIVIISVGVLIYISIGDASDTNLIFCNIIPGIDVDQLFMLPLKLLHFITKTIKIERKKIDRVSSTYSSRSRKMNVIQVQERTYYNK